MLLNMKPIAVDNYSSVDLTRNEVQRVFVNTCPELLQIEINSTAKALLQYCNGQNSIEDIVHKFVSRYSNVTVSQIREDIGETLRFFEKTRIVKYESECQTAFVDEATQNYKSGEQFVILDEYEIKNHLMTLNPDFISPYYDLASTQDIEYCLTLNFFSLEKTVQVNYNNEKVLSFVFRILPNKSKAIEVSRMYLFSEKNIDVAKYVLPDILKSINRMYSIALKKDIIKVRMFTNAEDERSFQLTQKLGFCVCGMLQREIEGKDLCVHEFILT